LQQTDHLGLLRAGARPGSPQCWERAVTGQTPGNPKYVALYDLAFPGVIDTPEWKQVSAWTPLPSVFAQISDRPRLVG
jgi:hypothetical protein